MGQSIKTFAVLGGDMRQISLAQSLLGDGYRVIIYGFDNTVDLPDGAQAASSAPDAVRAADCVILPLPFTADGECLNAPFSDGCTPVAEVLDAVEPRQLVVGGKLGREVFTQAGRRGFHVVDYLEREEMAIMNSIPTAEGALQIAMEETPITLHGSRCLIIGYGRIGRVLAGMLRGLGAGVSVCARKHKDLAWAAAEGCEPVPMDRLADAAGRADVVFNTAPAMVLTRAALAALSEEALVIDLASKPGGVDFAAAQSMGIRVIWALSLPGKVAPRTSGEIIKRTVLNICGEVEADG